MLNADPSTRPVAAGPIKILMHWGHKWFLTWISYLLNTRTQKSEWILCDCSWCQDVASAGRSMGRGWGVRELNSAFSFLSQPSTTAPFSNLFVLMKRTSVCSNSLGFEFRHLFNHLWLAKAEKPQISTKKAKLHHTCKLFITKARFSKTPALQVHSLWTQSYKREHGEVQSCLNQYFTGTEVNHTLLLHRSSSSQSTALWNNVILYVEQMDWHYLHQSKRKPSHPTHA